MADPEDERVRLGVVGNVLVIRGEDRHPPLVVARVDDEVHGFFDPLGGLLGPEIVQHEQVGGHHRPQNLELGRADRRVVGAADEPQQIAGVVEEAARAGRLDDLLQDGDRQVRLADTRLTFEEQPLVDDRKALGELARSISGALERLVVDGEVRDRAVLVALRHVRVGQPQLPDALAPAVAAHDAAHAIGIDGLPAGVVAKRARHAPTFYLRPFEFAATTFRFWLSTYPRPDSAAWCEPDRSGWI